ncbi:cytidine deaminase [Adhaeribacter pallidiroseus]|uniref:Cytidine deaminase n=1 Tax=Adhaeribacter pallidiroseus TaxID=2072847 RepID=A0A369QF23_9BACT|nr:cytidine deaminase [Adhaeribacter pallidiroseus]RDC63511.1 Cytidine deaminase [Adhaeribacter pallidiroseus]
MAYAPYSSFHVGAAILLNDNTIHTGNNQENAVFPSGLCAERTALFGLMAHHPPMKIIAIAVTARRINIGATPGGACRQVIAEYENRQNASIPVLIQVGPETFYRCQSVQDLLPLQFSQERFKQIF